MSTFNPANRANPETGYLCPCCQEGWLQLVQPDKPEDPYVVECPCCGTSFHHKLMGEGINGVTKWELDYSASEPEVDEVENWAYDEKTEWECSGCYKRRKYHTGEPPFAFCPDCGKPVAKGDAR